MGGGLLMGRKGEFLRSRAEELVDALRRRGWEVNGDGMGFTATFRNVGMSYDDGEVTVCLDGEGIARLGLMDVMGSR